MYDHIGLKVGNLDASVRFYTAALAPLGYVLCSHDNSGAAFGPRGEPRCGFIRIMGRQGPAPTSRSAPPITRRSRNSMPRAAKPEVATTARLGHGRITARPISRRS